MEEAISVSGLGKRYPNGTWGIFDVSFKSLGRTITVILGPNGAGKTTTIKVLATLLKPTKGKAYVLGYDVVKDAKKLRRMLALCPQDIRVDPNWTPYEAVVGYLLCRGFSLGDARKEARRWLDELSLWDVRNTPVAKLSGGQGKRVAVAMVLASNADVYILDEPTSGLDVEGKYRVWRALRRALSKGATILLTTHDMKEAEIVMDKVVMIHRGHTIAEGGFNDIVSKVPYRFKVVMWGCGDVPRGVGHVIDLGDRVIIYVSSRHEALRLTSQLSCDSITVSGIGLEDAYMYLVHTMGR